MTEIVYEPAELRLRMEGHAGAGAYGEDPVCAALPGRLKQTRGGREASRVEKARVRASSAGQPGGGR